MMTASSDPGIIWRAFRHLREQLERLIALNLLWSLPLIPGVLGLAFGEWPLAIRTLLVGFSLLALPPVTLALYALVWRACEGEDLTVAAATEALSSYTKASLTSFAPLVLGYCALLGLVFVVPTAGVWLIPATALRLLLLFGSLLYLYWGPLIIATQLRAPLALLRASLRYLLRYPAKTLTVWLAGLLATAIGAVSVGGVFLIVAVLIALWQTELMRELKEVDGGRFSHERGE